MLKRKSSAGFTKGGWDVLPHGMGQAPKRRYNTRSRAKDALPASPDSSVSPTSSVDDEEPLTETPVEEPPCPPDSHQGQSNVSFKDEDAPSQKAVYKPTKSRKTLTRVVTVRGIAVIDGIATLNGKKATVDAGPLTDPDYKPRLPRGKINPYGLTIGRSPYPNRAVPTAEECENVHKILSDTHGKIVQPDKMPAAALDVAGCGEVPSVLDALLRTLISGNTLMARADAALKNLVERYGLMNEGVGKGSINWEAVRLSSHEELEQTIKTAGCAELKGRHIKAILDIVHEDGLARANLPSNGSRTTRQTAKVGTSVLSLDHMHTMSKDDAMAQFLRFPGIGVKTAACVILFCLRIPCFAVDTHVHRFCQWLGWVPLKANDVDCYNHGEFMVPDHLKYGLHQLFIRHGQDCYKCRKATRPGTKEWNEAPECPLEELLTRNKRPVAAPKPNRRKTEKMQLSDEDELDGSMGEEGSDTDGQDEEQSSDKEE